MKKKKKINKKYLKESKIIDFSNKKILSLAKKLSKNCKDDEQIAKNCFEYVRDNINHSGDIKAKITTYKASDVLKHKTAWCYAKAHLLTALLRANNIPSGFCYQRLSYFKGKKRFYCLHGLNAVYLKKHGWYKIDPRGNKKEINSKFTPPYEKLAFNLQEDEYDFKKIYSKPLKLVVKALKKHKSYKKIKNNMPDISSKNLKLVI